MSAAGFPGSRKDLIHTMLQMATPPIVIAAPKSKRLCSMVSLLPPLCSHVCEMRTHLL